MWDSRARSDHYTGKQWLERSIIQPGQHNVTHLPLIPQEKIILPPLHIKLGLFKQFVKAVSKESSAFEFLQKSFPSISYAKIKEGIFVGPQIRKLIFNHAFDETLNSNELDAWTSFKEICQNFSGV